MSNNISGKNTCIDCIFGEFDVKKQQILCHECRAYVELCRCEHYVSCCKMEETIKAKAENGEKIFGKNYFK